MGALSIGATWMPVSVVTRFAHSLVCEVRTSPHSSYCVGSAFLSHCSGVDRLQMCSPLSWSCSRSALAVKTPSLSGAPMLRNHIFTPPSCATGVVRREHRHVAVVEDRGRWCGTHRPSRHAVKSTCRFGGSRCRSCQASCYRYKL